MEWLQQNWWIILIALILGKDVPFIKALLEKLGLDTILGGGKEDPLSSAYSLVKHCETCTKHHPDKAKEAKEAILTKVVPLLVEDQL